MSARRVCSKDAVSCQLAGVDPICAICLLEDAQVHVGLGHSPECRFQTSVPPVPDIVSAKSNRHFFLCRTPSTLECLSLLSDQPIVESMDTGSPGKYELMIYPMERRIQDGTLSQVVSRKLALAPRLPPRPPYQHKNHTNRSLPHPHSGPPQQPTLSGKNIYYTRP